MVPYGFHNRKNLILPLQEPGTDLKTLLAALLLWWLRLSKTRASRIHALLSSLWCCTTAVKSCNVTVEKYFRGQWSELVRATGLRGFNQHSFLSSVASAPDLHVLSAHVRSLTSAF